MCLFLIYHTGCQPEFPKEIKQFYYPVDQLDEGLVYHYKSTTNDMKALDQYWFFKGNNLKNNSQFTGRYYNHHKQMLQYFSQNINKSGALLDEYQLYTTDSNSEVIPVDILYNNVFPFEIKDTSAVYLYKLQYTSSADSSITTIIRNRRYSGQLDWEYRGLSYPAVQMALLEQIQNDKNGVITIDLKGYEIYAKGIGLVYTERFTQDGSTHIVDRLIDRISPSDFKVASLD